MLSWYYIHDLDDFGPCNACGKPLEKGTRILVSDDSPVFAYCCQGCSKQKPQQNPRNLGEALHRAMESKVVKRLCNRYAFPRSWRRAAGLGMIVSGLAAVVTQVINATNQPQESDGD